ncbi:hypothetical protein ASPZODRAFT_62418 [Penicilliopsis zonata CBS 506.65]|uniref:Reverse transcriptase domain-containing protein n=1 Tax=Penicilliopsis zonata CBS 506.65 TaxID=1073090 RepID=A0A1L9SNI1_9EURO|nr:hypothetical protein ASPZODRAFT_62418 [Penicilliopsis zonata CBS 506.65]OJJ48614.1 hypothetical protein ASPZODRAFT_62418 [Penicilliopsis zonata CBS 506.65]
MSSKSEFSQMLQHITNTKLDELSNKRQIFLQRKEVALQKAGSLESTVDQLCALSDGLKACFGIPVVNGRMVRGQTSSKRLEITLANLDRFLEQARYDPCISWTMLERWRNTLLGYLNTQTLKYEYATLFAKLTMEWLSTKKKLSDEEDVSMTEDFEDVLGASKLESRRKWEEAVFTPAEVDGNAIRSVLEELFQGTPENTKRLGEALNELRRVVSAFESTLAHPQQFNVTTLGWVISGLVASDLLTEEKRAVLRDFQNNNIILIELADVLNMRMMALHTWGWGAEVPVEQRRQLNGTYNIYMHEDLIQAIFLQYIGVKWSVFFKDAFVKFRRTKDVWKSPRAAVSLVDKKRREFFLGNHRATHSVLSMKQGIYRAGFFAVVYNDNGSEDDDNYDDNDDDGIIHSMTPKNPMEAKQYLLHLLSTDILIKTRLQGGLTCFRSQYDSWNPRLPHTTILTVLRFLGVSEKWIGFFERFLKAPLKFLDDDNAEPRLRQRGTPGAHVLSDVFGETTLFCLDFLINQKTNGEFLWRVHDDLWFWSSNHQTCVTAWKAIQEFNKILGLSLNAGKTGSATISLPKTKDAPKADPELPTGQIRWGMLYLNPESGRFEIDQNMVDSHVEELQRQLEDQEKSVFGWIQAWNSYATTFFTSNFGKPANCFGRRHLDMMLEMHERIQRRIFSLGPDGGKSDSSVLEFLRDTIRSRFNITSTPDGYFFLPIELGGLELSSPFIHLVGLRNSVLELPASQLDKFLAAERDAYLAAKHRFEQRSQQQQQASMYNNNNNTGGALPDTQAFLSFEEYVRFREEVDYGFSGQLADVFETLLQRPEQQPLISDEDGEVCGELARLAGQPNLRGIQSSWHQMDPYWKWVAQLYGPEVIETFGGLNIVDPGLLPIGMVSLFRSGGVKWQED